MQNFLLIFLLDTCSKKDCPFYGKCVELADGQTQCVCPMCIEDRYDVVCANDGLNYASQCWMERESCLKSQNLEVAKREPCSKSSVVEGFCISKYGLK